MEMSFNFAPVFVFAVVCILLFLLHNFGGVKLFIDKDRELSNKFLDKFPLVSSDFMNKTTKEQNIENNQEIHEMNKRMVRLEADLYDIRENILSKLDDLTKRIEK